MKLTARRIITPLAAAGIAAGVLVGASPAQAGQSSYFHIGCDYVSADIYVNNGTIGRAYAQHGNYSALTNWVSSHARAVADTGYSCTATRRAWTQWA